ncbi:MAG: hypothetical protein CMJ59_14070 [Planctomycetaceae bacterium]|nr:hypothetical protein [Planctomycetaceae bacterium]
MRLPNTFLTLLLLCWIALPSRAELPWKRSVVYSGASCATAVAADFTGDGRVDVICNAGNVTRLLVAPKWTEVVLAAEPPLGLIHSETMDADGDGDPDFIGARYSPGLVFWLERPQHPLKERWPMRVVDERVNGIHGLLVGDVDSDGTPDLLANSAQPVGPFKHSLVWYRRPRAAEQSWTRSVFARGDAPGLSHYLGLGDVNGDGRPDAASGAKGGPQDTSRMGNWFAWWEAPRDPTGVWTKHLISDSEPGATNIHPADVNGDGQTDFVASRGHGQGVVWFEAPHWKRHDIHATLRGPHCLVVCDLDGDGDPDAATCAKDDRLAVWFENDGRGQFTTHVVGRDQAAYDIRAVDIDGDGDLDLLVAGQASQNVVWYANPTR